MTLKEPLLPNPGMWGRPPNLYCWADGATCLEGLGRHGLACSTMEHWLSCQSLAFLPGLQPAILRERKAPFRGIHSTEEKTEAW